MSVDIRYMYQGKINRKIQESGSKMNYGRKWRVKNVKM